MATSPSPNSSPSVDPPVSTTAPPPQPLSPPPAPPTNSQPNASSPTATPPTLPSQSPPSTNLAAPPPVPLSSPPPQPPIASPPPPTTLPSPHPPADVPPPSSNSPPPSPNLPASPPTPTPPVSPPTPTSTPPVSPPASPPLPPASPPTPIPTPPVSPPTPTQPVSPSTPTPPASPPPPLTPPASPPTPIPTPPVSPPTPIHTPPASPPTPPSEPPKNSAPPPPKPSENTPPPPSQPPEKPPSSKPPKISPPPSESKPPQNSPTPPEAEPPKISPPSPPTPNISPPPPVSSPSSNSPPKLSTPSPRIQLSPPPSLVPPSSPSPPSPSQVPIWPSDNLPTNKSNTPSNSSSTDNGGIGTGGTVAIVLVLGLILLSLIGTIVWCVRKRKRKFTGFNGGHIIPTSLSSSSKSDSALLKVQTSGAWNGTGSAFVYSPTEPGGLGNSRSWFTYEELVDATNEFSVQNLLGEGGFGSVYKGNLADGREIAVKQLKIGGGQGEREFKAEVEIISRVHHRHLVSLVGYCISENQRLLVYDYVPNNNLYFHLHGEGRPVMEWETRVKVAIGAARGIAYLHEDCHPRIIHRDIKSSNILLDNSFEAQVSDFGLAKLALDANTHITTRVMGTFGYMAPEYAASGKLSEKSDVYSFGVVLLELITGRKPVDASQPLGDESLVEWARPLLSHALETEDFKALADPRLESNYVDGEMFRLIEAAAACVRHSAAKRPQMGQVVRAFDNMTNSDLANGMRVGESEILNSAQQSAEIRLFQRMAFGSQNYSTDFFSQSSWE